MIDFKYNIVERLETAEGIRVVIDSNIDISRRLSTIIDTHFGNRGVLYKNDIHDSMFRLSIDIKCRETICKRLFGPLNNKDVQRANRIINRIRATLADIRNGYLCSTVYSMAEGVSEIYDELKSASNGYRTLVVTHNSLSAIYVISHTELTKGKNSMVITAVIVDSKDKDRVRECYLSPRNIDLISIAPIEKARISIDLYKTRKNKSYRNIKELTDMVDRVLRHGLEAQLGSVCPDVGNSIPHITL